MIYDITHALSIIRPNSSWSCDGDTYEGLSWLDDNTEKPTLEEINDAIINLNNDEPLRLLRVERSKRLSETDWEIQRNIEMEIDNTELINYRISLRNLPQEIESGNIQPPTIDDNGNLVFNSWPER